MDKKIEIIFRKTSDLIIELKELKLDNFDVLLVGFSQEETEDNKQSRDPKITEIKIP